MKVIYKNYELRVTENSTDRFDLVKITTKRRVGTGTQKEPNGEEYEAETDMGYGMTFSYCLQKIIFDITSETSGEVATIKDYIKEFEKQREELKNYIENKVKLN